IRFSFVLIACNGTARSRLRTRSDETVQSTSMSGKISLALLASVSCLCFANQAAAFDAQRPGERMIYSYQSPQPAPRMAYAERSQMGGGFIEFLFGDGPQGGRYQQPSYE